MSDPKPVARCGGFRAILMALTDNLQDLSDALLKVFLYMLESPETRGYVRQGLDSEVMHAPRWRDKNRNSLFRNLVGN